MAHRRLYNNKTKRSLNDENQYVDAIAFRIDTALKINYSFLAALAGRYLIAS
ncbi:MAG: hypothetical protein M3N42_14750 [Cyanobacteriota bacterium]|nr:hypothetical protein [Cyanobacteriota bacterium]